jgi:hypothetical protein
LGIKRRIKKGVTKKQLLRLTGLLKRKEREVEARCRVILMLRTKDSSVAGWTAALPCSAMRLSERRMPALKDELEWTVHTVTDGQSVQVWKRL